MKTASALYAFKRFKASSEYHFYYEKEGELYHLEYYDVEEEGYHTSFDTYRKNVIIE